MRKLIFIAFLLLSVIKIQAQEVKENLAYVGVGGNGLTYYVNTKTIRKDSGDMIKVWVYGINEGKNKIDPLIPKNLKTVKIHYEINCKKYSMRIIRYSEYDDKGINISDTDASFNEFKEVIPDTIGETILNTVCNN